MITIKNKQAIDKMKTAGSKLATLFERLPQIIKVGVTTLEIDTWIADFLVSSGLTSRSLGYRGYGYSSCISLNDEVIHGVPRKDVFLHAGDLLKIDVCASWKDYCADMARTFIVDATGLSSLELDAKKNLINTAQQALDKGILNAQLGARLGNISAAIQYQVEVEGCSVIRDFAGHGIGKKLHEEPEILNYGTAGVGPILREGMALAIEPMISAGNYEVYIAQDGWTVKTVDKSLAAHVEDTIIISSHGPEIITR